MRSRMSRLAVAASAAATVALVAPASPARAITGDAAAVSAAANPYAFVGRSATRRSDGRHALCTVELIEPQIAITARHCTTGSDYPRNTEIVFGGTRLDGGAALPAGERYTVADVVRNSDADVALLRLTRPVAGIAPVPVATAAAGNAVQRGRTATVVGWGNTDTGGTGTTVLRSAAHIVVQRTDKSFLSRKQHSEPVPSLLTVPGYFRPGDGAYVGTGQWAVSGDSGGPLLVHDSGRVQLAGVFTTFFPRRVGPIGGTVKENFFTNVAASGRFGLHDWMSRHREALRRKN